MRHDQGRNNVKPVFYLHFTVIATRREFDAYVHFLAWAVITQHNFDKCMLMLGL